MQNTGALWKKKSLPNICIPIGTISQIPDWVLETDEYSTVKQELLKDKWAIQLIIQGPKIWLGGQTPQS